ncbi:protein kinase family protein, partial [Vibrio diabolicus]
SLVLSVVAMTGSYLYQQNSDALDAVFAKETTPLSHTITPTDTASFLAEPPWKIKEVLAKIEQSVDTTEAYREAYRVQQLSLSGLYNEKQTQLKSYQALADGLPQTLVDLRKELVTLREELVRDGALFPYADETLTKVMSGLNVASIDSMKVSAIAGSRDKQIARLILSGEAKLAEEEVKEAWLLNQSQAYFYSQILPKRVMENINDSIDKHAEAHFYTKAIEEAELAKDY